MARFLVAIALTAVTCLAAPKERAWQNGRLLSNYDTRFFSRADIVKTGNNSAKDQYGTFDYSVNTPGANASAVYETYMFEVADAAYLAQVAHLKTARPIHLSQISPVKLAVEKNKLWFVDQDGAEYQADILKQVKKQVVAQVAPQDVPKAPVAAQPEPQPAAVAVAVKIPEPAPAPAPAVKPAPAPKPEPVVVAKVQKPEPVAARPAPPPPAPVAKPKPEPKPQPVVEAAAPRPNMVQGSDGRFSLASEPKSYASNSTFDNYVIESQFCAYLVQRWRPKTSPMARFPGTTALKFAVDKSKLFVLDEDGKEYETKIVKLVQREAVDTQTRIVSR